MWWTEEGRDSWKGGGETGQRRDGKEMGIRRHDDVLYGTICYACVFLVCVVLSSLFFLVMLLHGMKHGLPSSRAPLAMGGGICALEATRGTVCARVGQVTLPKMSTYIVHVQVAWHGTATARPSPARCLEPRIVYTHTWRMYRGGSTRRQPRATGGLWHDAAWMYM